MNINDWVVCLDYNLNPSTWGQVYEAGKMVAWVKYADDAPIWTSKAWDIEYLQVCDSEKTARKIVRDYEGSLEYGN